MPGKAAVYRILDVIVFVGLALVCFAIKTDGPLYDAYVSCDDARYRNPVRPSSEHLVPNLWLYIGVLLIFPGLFFASEALLTFRYPTNSSRSSRKKPSDLLMEYIDNVALYYTGVLFMFIISKISRGIGGSPAPYFLTLCSPGCSNATSQYTDQRTMRNYVTHASCPQEEMLPDTLASFPSLHAMLSFYGASFIMFVYASKRPTSYSRLLQPAIIFMATALTLVTSLSRISEFTNHVIDVLAGVGIGATIAFIQVRSMTILRRYESIMK